MPKPTGVLKRYKKWYYRISYKGKRIEKGGFTTAEQAYRARIEHIKKLQDQIIPPADITVRQLIIQYLEEHEKIYNRLSTVWKNEGTCRNHIIPYLGDRKVKGLKPTDMKKFQGFCVKNKTPSVAHYTMRTLKKIFNWAMEWEIIQYNPIKGKLPPEPTTEHPTVQPEKLFKMIHELKGREKIIVSLGALAGMRIGEIFGLKWDDIDFKENTIYIRRQYSSGVLGPVKTIGSRSIIPIWDKISFMLKEWKLQSGSPEWVFKGIKDNPLRSERWRQLRWNKIKKEYCLPQDLRFHDLRHSFASILIGQGADKGDVQKLLRHKSISMTMDIYRHLQPKTLSRVFEIFNSLSGEGRGEGQALNQ